MSREREKYLKDVSVEKKTCKQQLFHKQDHKARHNSIEKFHNISRSAPNSTPQLPSLVSHTSAQRKAFAHKLQLVASRCVSPLAYRITT